MSSKKEYYYSLVSSASGNPKHLWQTINKLLHRKSSSPLPTTSPGTCGQLCLSFHRQNIQTPFLSHQQPHYIISAYLLMPLPLTSQFSPLPRNPKSTKSYPTVQTSNPTQIPYRPGFLKNAHQITSSSLLNSHQSAYCKHHCTETALLYTHDHLVSAIGSQKVSCFCLLDLSAAFDTIDHDI